jgi:hypothetical protein
MNWWVVVGTGSLGLTMGWLVCLFVHRAPKLELTAISTLAAIIGGGALLGLWHVSKTDPLPNEANAYFIGIFISILGRGILMRAWPGFH